MENRKSIIPTNEIETLLTVNCPELFGKYQIVKNDLEKLDQTREKAKKDQLISELRRDYKSIELMYVDTVLHYDLEHWIDASHSDQMNILRLYGYQDEEVFVRCTLSSYLAYIIKRATHPTVNGNHNHK